MAHIVVAGAGMAGARSVEALRAEGHTGPITLVGAEDHPPYDRPPLSKDVLKGKADESTLAIDWPSLDITVRSGVRATALLPGAVDTTDGPVPFDRLIIATGATPVRLPGQGPQRVLRTIEDAHALRAALSPGRRIAVVGAGWIGAEVATAAAAAGAEVTVVEAADAPLSVALGSEIGAFTVPWYAEAGVELRLDTKIASVAEGGLELADGSFLPADEVVTGVGVRPATDWLAGSGVTLDDGRLGGVHVDAHLRTNIPGVLAAGDCAAFVSRRYGRRLRVEHWDTALNAPRVAAANALAAETAGGQVYDPVPYFWSEQFGRMVQYAGHRVPGAVAVWRGDPATEKWSVIWLDGDRITAVLTVGRPRDLVQSRRAMAAGRAVDPVRLADPEVAVRDALAPEG
jgi:NADPH-dependent 2,4-dienoyl-CoA reductase/sulfur reductase-like enzyme